MPDLIKKKIKIIKADYDKKLDAIIVLGKYKNGEVVKHEIKSNCFSFGDKDKIKEMEKTARLMIGKSINIIFDEDIDRKIKDYDLK